MDPRIDGDGTVPNGALDLGLVEHEVSLCSPEALVHSS
jgi:hypothetical protein